MGRYRRTVSFPNPIPNFQPTNGPRAAKSYHVRSASLPCARANPLIPQLRDEIVELRVWDRTGNRAGSSHLCDGLARLKSVLDSLDDVLQMPQTQDSLSTRTSLVERLLEDFLRFVDVYGIFHASMLGLKEEVSGAQVAIRRKDSTKLGPHVKAQRKIASEISKLVSAIESVVEQPVPYTAITLDYTNDEELAGVIRDVHALTASVSAAVFNGITSSFGLGRKLGWAGLGLAWRARKEDGGIEEFHEAIEGVESLRKKGDEKNNNEEMRMRVLKRLQELEDCVGEMEKGSEIVFRSLISTRVSLLNILTHA